MTIRAKFRLIGWRNTLGSRPKTKPDPDGILRWEECLMASLEFTAVVGNSPENQLFWNATPSGKLELNIINPEAVKELNLGKEYYIDIIEAPSSKQPGQ